MIYLIYSGGSTWYLQENNTLLKFYDKTVTNRCQIQGVLDTWMYYVISYDSYRTFLNCFIEHNNSLTPVLNQLTSIVSATIVTN